MTAKIPSWVIWLSYIAVAAALLMPLFAVTHPQSIDFANHLARVFIRHEQPQSPALASFYEFRTMVFPYLAFEGLAWPLLRVFDVYTTGRIIIGLAVLLWLAAPAILHRALWKKWSLWPLLAALVVYNATMTWGFIDYYITSALAMIALSGWIATENAKPLPRIAGFSVIGFLIYCCHLQGFAVFGLLTGGYELGKMIRDKKLTPRNVIMTGLMLAPVFLPALLHFLYTSLTLPPVHRLESVSTTWADRGLLLASPFMYGMHTDGVTARHDISTASAFLIVAAFGLLWQGKNIGLHKYMAAAVVITGALALVVPPQVLGISFTHYRLPFVAIALLIAATRPLKTDDATVRVLAMAFVVVLGLRLSYMTDVWKRYDTGVQEFIAAAKGIKPGDRALVLNRDYPAGYVEHLHTGSYLTIARQAFIPNLFTLMPYFKAKGDFARLSPPTAMHPGDARVLDVARKGKDKRLDEQGNAYFKTWWKDFDYVAVYERPEAKPLLPGLLKPVTRGSFFTIYKVRK